MIEARRALSFLCRQIGAAEVDQLFGPKNVDLWLRGGEFSASAAYRLAMAATTLSYAVKIGRVEAATWFTLTHPVLGQTPAQEAVYGDADRVVRLAKLLPLAPTIREARAH